MYIIYLLEGRLLSDYSA